MDDAPANASFVSRRSLFRLAWILFAISLLIPAPAGSPFDNTIGGSALHVYGKAIAWSEAVPGSPGSLGYWRGAILALALFSNIAFLYAPYLGRCPSISVAWKGFLLAALAIDAGVALLVPEFAHLPAYWIWLVAMVAVASGFFASPGDGAIPGAKRRKRESAIDRGEVPPFVWVLLGFTVFWLMVSAGNHVLPPPDRAAAAANAPLTAYVNDGAHVLKGDEASDLTFALQKFEALTPNQIAVAIYPRAPAGSIEEFTIRIADRSRLGRFGLDTGAILFVFMNERAARLEVGYGLEGPLTDADAHRILEADLAPAFARGKYFEGLDATLKAIFGKVQDAYKREGMPGKLTVWGRQLKAERPKRLANLWPLVSGVGLAARIGITFLGSFIVLFLWFGVPQWIQLTRDLGRGVINLKSRRPFLAGMEPVKISEIVDSLRLLGWALVTIVPAAGVILIAGGGAFGGAGALIHW